MQYVGLAVYSKRPYNREEYYISVDVATYNLAGAFSMNSRSIIGIGRM